MSTDSIKEKAIALIAAALNDEEIPASKRADMALSLLGKQALKDTQDENSAMQPISVYFVETDAEGHTSRRFGYEFVPRCADAGA